MIDYDVVVVREVEFRSLFRNCKVRRSGCNLLSCQELMRRNQKVKVKGGGREMSDSVVESGNENILGDFPEYEQWTIRKDTLSVL